MKICISERSSIRPEIVQLGIELEENGKSGKKKMT
jgi:hypothetical protein